MSVKRNDKTLFLPDTVKKWMCYTDNGELRAPMFRHGNYTDKINGYSIRWRQFDRLYEVKIKGEPVMVFTNKHDAYEHAKES